MSGCDFCESDGMTALLRRDWAVRVLDAWALHGTPRCAWAMGASASERRCDVVWPGGGSSFEGAPDAARHAAALAVFPTLPDAVRAELGECP